MTTNRQTANRYVATLVGPVRMGAVTLALRAHATALANVRALAKKA